MTGVIELCCQRSCQRQFMGIIPPLPEIRQQPASGWVIPESRFDEQTAKHQGYSGCGQPPDDRTFVHIYLPFLVVFSFQRASQMNNTPVDERQNKQGQDESSRNW